MKVKEYVGKNMCEKSTLFDGLETGDKTNLYLYQMLQNICLSADTAAKKTGGLLEREQLMEVKVKADAYYREMVSLIGKEMGEGHLVKRKLELMLKFYNRFIKWFLPFLKHCKVLSYNATASLPIIDWKKEAVRLEETVPLVIEKEGVAFAIVFHAGKNSKMLGLNSRKPEKRIENDMRYALIKTSLEDVYPGINVAAVFYQEGESKGEVSEWLVGDTTKTNVAIMPFSDCYDDGEFNATFCLSKAEAVLAEACEKPMAAKCDSCRWKSECQVQTLSHRKMVEKGQIQKWQMPQFDKWQQSYVDSTEGSILVLAGPGSGKTASSMGRVKALVDKGTSSEKIMLVTYTEKAAGEMRSRLRGYYAEDEMPKVGTLHSVASEIISLYEKANDLPRSRPLSKYAEKKLLKSVLDASKELTGVSYRTYTDGKFNTIATVHANLQKLQENRDYFFEKNPAFIPEEWDSLQEKINALKRQQKYITYDEMLEQAADILKMDNSIRKYYHNKYDYIMVDEYQDANAPQDRLVNLLNGKGNLACVGDDDQSIFGFNGSSPEYVHTFQKRHPEAKVLYLPVNYRTTRSLVDFNNRILSLMDEKQRIGKHIQSGEAAVEGCMPIYVENNEPSTIDMIIQRYIEKGYRYSDIAIEATQNKFLTMLNDRLKTPTELASAYVVGDFLFNLCRSLLSIVLEKGSQRNAWVRLGYLLEKERDCIMRMTGNVLPEDVNELIEFAMKQKEETPEHFVARIAAYYDLDESPSEAAVLSVAKYTGNLSELYEIMEDMVTYGDEKKLEYPIKDCVTLITSHSCKGKEWKVVIIYDTESYVDCVSDGSNNSMDLRLLYVASTRAMNELCFLKSDGSSCVLDTQETLREVLAS